MRIKKLTVEIEFQDIREVIKSLEKILQKIKYRTSNEGRELTGSCLTEWSIQNFTNNEFDHKIEFINGNKCMIIPSKMNRS